MTNGSYVAIRIADGFRADQIEVEITDGILTEVTGFDPEYQPDEIPVKLADSTVLSPCDNRLVVVTEHNEYTYVIELF